MLDNEPESSSEESDFDDNVQVNAEIDLPPALDMKQETPILPEERTKRRRVRVTLRRRFYMDFVVYKL